MERVRVEKKLTPPTPPTPNHQGDGKRQMTRGRRRWTGQIIRHNIGRSWSMANVTSRYIRQLLLLVGGPGQITQKRAETRGRWSVMMWNPRPSNSKRKLRRARKTPNNSLSKAEYHCWVAESLAEKKARGHSLVFSLCCRTAPMCEAEASVTRDTSADREGWVSGMVEERADLAFSNEFWCISDQCNDLGLPAWASVIGRRILRARLQEECFNMTAEWNDSCSSNLVTKIINF